MFKSKFNKKVRQQRNPKYSTNLFYYILISYHNKKNLLMRPQEQSITTYLHI